MANHADKNGFSFEPAAAGWPLLSGRLRRRVISLASTAAAVGLGGCMGARAPVATTADMTSRQDVVQRVQTFTDGIDTAIDKVDPDQLKAVGGGVAGAGGEKSQPNAGTQVVLATAQSETAKGAGADTKSTKPMNDGAGAAQDADDLECADCDLAAGESEHVGCTNVVGCDDGDGCGAAGASAGGEGGVA